MKKNLFKLLFLMLFLLTVSVTIVFNNNNSISADEIENVEEIVEPSLNIYKKNISYSSEIYVMYAVSYEGIDVTTNPVKMLFYNSVQDEYTTQTASYVALSQGSVNIGGVSCQIFASNGLAAKQMTDDIYARAYVEIGEETIYSDVVKYSVLEYYYEIKEAGTVSTNILNLLEAMVNYGAAAQINFNYNTEKLANATYYKVNVENTVLPDGFTSGRFKAEEQISLTAFEKEGYVFTGWTNANGDVVSTDVTYTLTVTQDEVLTANYEEEVAVTPVTLTLTKEAAYDATVSTLDLPTTVSFDYNNEIVTEDVTWDTTSFVVNQIGKQKLYGTLSNDSYKVNELSIEIDVLPYTFSLDTVGDNPTISKYYGNETEVIIPSKFNDIQLKRIGDEAFMKCTSIMNVVIPEGVISIGENAFYGCSSLANVYYEGTIESWCNISFSGNVSNPMSYAEHFYMKNEEGNWYEVTEIEIPNTITKIGNKQFYGFDNITSVIIPKEVTSIGNSAFYKCNSLTSIEIPENVASIGSAAFYGCNNLISIEIPENVASIESSTFYGCSNLTSIEIPKGVTNIELYAFHICSNLTNVYYEGTIESWCNISIADTVSSPMSYAEHFYMKNEEGNWYEVTEIEIPNTITEIGKYQFYGFDNITSVIIPNSVTSIDSHAFSSCTNLTNITIPSSVTSIGYSAFSSCSSLMSIEIFDGIMSIGHSAFSGCSSLMKIEIPNSVTSIDGYTFINCSSLTSITIPRSVTNIRDYAFKGCSSLTNITIQKELTYVGSYAFDGCNSLTNVYYEGTIESWCNILFVYASSSPMYYADHFYMKNEEGNWYEVTEIEIPNTITEIGNYQFCGFEKVTSISIIGSVTSIGRYAFYGCNNLISITIPKGVNNIGEQSFYGCSSLTNVKIPEGVISIDNFVFYNCQSLTSITIPSSLTSFGYAAFYNCSSLKNVYYEGTIESWCNILFDTGDSNPMYHADHFNMKNEEGNWYEVTEIEIPNTITEIGECQFYGFGNVISITIPSSVTNIRNHSFYECSSLASIIILSSAITIEDYAFYECTNLITIYNLSDLELTIGSTDYGYVAYYAEVIYTTLPEKE